MKKLIIATFILLLATACNKQAQVQPVENQQQSAQQQSKPADQTANWKTYTNSQFGFQFQYPSDWTIKSERSVDDGTPLIVDFVDPSQEDAGHDVSIQLDSSVNERYNAKISFNEDLYGKMSDTVIDGVPAKRIIAITTPEVGAKHFLKVLVLKNNYVYTIQTTGFVTKDQQAINNLEQILLTFKFTK